MSWYDPTALFAQLQLQLSGRYLIEREVGRGAMARVLLAKDLHHDRAVAIKLLPPELAANDNAERFLREINITKGLDHPNILPLLDSGVSGSLYWYVMPFVRGQSLRERLKTSGAMPSETAVAIARQIGTALSHAHERGVVHRDLKPENVMWWDDRWVVMDFGLARAVGTDTRLTGTGMPLGTPAYMSPEQITGAATVDARADIYGLGCVLFEMLAGRPPFVGASVVNVLRAHMVEAPRGPSQFKLGIAVTLDRTVLRMLAKDPAQRPQTVLEVLGELTRGESEATPPEGMAKSGIFSRLFGKKT